MSTCRMLRGAILTWKTAKNSRRPHYADTHSSALSLTRALLTCRVEYTPSRRVDDTLSVLRKPVPHVGVRGMHATVTGDPP